LYVAFYVAFFGRRVSYSQNRKSTINAHAIEVV
jgi:hypothetical protein